MNAGTMAGFVMWVCTVSPDHFIVECAHIHEYVSWDTSLYPASRHDKLHFCNSWLNTFLGRSYRSHDTHVKFFINHTAATNPALAPHLAGADAKSLGHRPEKAAVSERELMLVRVQYRLLSSQVSYQVLERQRGGMGVRTSTRERPRDACTISLPC